MLFTKVRQEYINSAISYLQQDDVDLTAEQAQSVISEIYSNVQTGVDSGYLEASGRRHLRRQNRPKGAGRRN